MNLKKELEWRNLRRIISLKKAENRPDLFYPVFISEDKKRIIGAGEPLKSVDDYKNYKSPSGCIAIFPINRDGLKSYWSYSRDLFTDAQKQGFVKINNLKNGETAIFVLSKACQDSILCGDIKVIGKAEDGSVIIDEKD